MKLKGEIGLFVLAPLVAVLLVQSTLGFISIKNSNEDTVAAGLESSAYAIASSLQTLNDDDFEVKDGQLYKGDFNITQDTALVDSVREKTGVVSTVFYGDTRYLTSLKDESGKRVINTKADAKIYDKVIKNGERYVDQSVKLYGEKYFAVYVPLYEDANGQGKPVGMIFVGMPSNIANKAVYSIILKLDILLIAISVISFVFVMASVAKLSRAVGDATRALDQLADGNLRVNINKEGLRRKDEISKILRAVMNLRGQMSDVIGAMVEQSDSVQETAQQISFGTNQTAKAINQVDVAVGEISDGATSQASETQRATENVIVMGDMIEQTKEEVQALKEHAQDMKVAGDVASKTLAELDEINQKTKAAIEVIYRQTYTTNESALRIQEVTKMITGIAEETNLLSLNAAIEAARAGEQGRGFAVVASQIQKLAEQSNASTEEIAKIINVLIADAERAVETMNSVKKIMDEQIQNVERADRAFEEVRLGIEASINGVEKINDKTEKLDFARTNVIDIVQSLTAIAEENAASTEETSASVTEVSAIVEDIAQNAVHMEEYAEKLREKINVFSV